MVTLRPNPQRHHWFLSSLLPALLPTGPHHDTPDLLARPAGQSSSNSSRRDLTESKSFKTIQSSTASHYPHCSNVGQVTIYSSPDFCNLLLLPLSSRPLTTAILLSILNTAARKLLRKPSVMPFCLNLPVASQFTNNKNQVLTNTQRSCTTWSLVSFLPSSPAMFFRGHCCSHSDFLALPEPACHVWSAACWTQPCSIFPSNETVLETCIHWLTRTVLHTTLPLVSKQSNSHTAHLVKMEQYSRTLLFFWEYIPQHRGKHSRGSK